MRKVLLRILLLKTLILLLVVNSFASYINIGIIEHYNIQRFSFLPEKGHYQVFADSRKITEIAEGDLLFVIYRGDKIEIKTPRENFGSFNKVYLIGKDSENTFRVTPIEPDKNSRSYEDNLKITLKSKAMRLVNNVNMENYIAGVVQAEVGPTPAPEFFKLQSILCRTYALENHTKHEHQGYNLCDRVHCQAYYRRCTDKEIEISSNSTKSLVIVDSDIKLITAAFYSNCGGQTVNSEDVWQRPVYYLKSVKDPHCVNEPNAKWDKKVEKAKWVNYLKRKSYNYGQNPDSFVVDAFYQSERTTHYPVGNVKIPLKTIRSDWKLKSTFFSAVPNGEYVYLSGRGFGHGTGLCQEGAMKMASTGFSYPDILHFYYKDVHLIDMSALDFFREE